MPLDSTPKSGPKNAPSIGDMPPGLVHGTMIRGLAAGANPGQPYGRFGPMFELPVGPVVSDDILRELAEVIVKKDSGAPIMESEPVDENDIIPAGYTYFGQFVDHDITFDPTPMSVKEQDMGALVDFRTPALDLDNVYGRGPADQPYMYEKDGLRLRVGRTMEPAARIGAVETASGEIIEQGFVIELRVVTAQRKLEPVLTFGRAVTGAGCTAGLIQNGRDIAYFMSPPTGR